MKLCMGLNSTQKEGERVKKKRGMVVLYESDVDA